MVTAILCDLFSLQQTDNHSIQLHKRTYFSAGSATGSPIADYQRHLYQLLSKRKLGICHVLQLCVFIQENVPMVCKDCHPAGKPFQHRNQQIIQVVQRIPVLGGIVRFQLSPISAQEIKQYTGSLCHQISCRIRIGIGVMALIKYMDIEQSVVFIRRIQQEVPQLLRRGLVAVRHLYLIAFHIVAEICIEMNLSSLAYCLFDKRTLILLYLALFIISCAQIIVSAVCGNQALIGRCGR